MTVSLEQVVAGVKARLDGIYGLTVYDYPAANLELPAAVIMPGPGDYRMAMGRGVVTVDLQVHVYVSAAAGHEKSKGLWPYIDHTGAASIMLAIDGDRSLGILGADDQPRVDAHVAGHEPIGLVELPERAFGEAFTLPVIITNKE